MTHFIAIIIAISLSSGIVIIGRDVQKDIFNPDSQLLESFSFEKNRLSFNGENLNGLRGKYEIIFNKPLSILTSDNISISYDMNLNRLMNVREIKVNGEVVWDEGSENKITLKEIKQ